MYCRIGGVMLVPARRYCGAGAAAVHMVAVGYSFSEETVQAGLMPTLKVEALLLTKNKNSLAATSNVNAKSLSQVGQTVLGQSRVR